MLAFVLALRLWVPTAQAHPFASNLHGHRTAVWLDRDEIAIAYVAEIPTIELLRELKLFLAEVAEPGPTDQERFDDAKHHELAEGFRLLVDGETVELTLQPDEVDDGRGDSRFITYRLSLRAAMPADARTVQLVNGNMPDSQAMFMSELAVSDGLMVDASNLYEVSEGVVRHDLSGSWRADESLRELRVSLRRRSERQAALGRWLRGRFGDEEPWRSGRSALSVEARPVDAALATGEVPRVLLVGLAAAAAVLLGGVILAVSRLRRSR